MAKNVKTNGGNVKTNSPIPFPQKMTFDELAVIDDESLMNMHKSLVDSISRVNSHSLNPEAWEKELCYVQREVQIRGARREAHVKYLATLPAVEVD